MTGQGLSWWGIVRLALVQTALGSVVVLTTNTINRVMVVELALPAMLPAALVAWHYAVQLSRPTVGHGSDRGGNRSRWIVGGLAVLAFGAMLAADATSWMAASPVLGIAAGLVAYAMIGAGVASAGTALLALLTTRVAERRRPAAAAIAWVMMILGIVVTAAVSGAWLDPFSPERLVLVVSIVSGLAFLLGVLALGNLEARTASLGLARPPAAKQSMRAVLRQLWRERLVRDFTLFVFVSMLAYSAEELILEPFAGLVFGYTLGNATQLVAMQHGGVLIGMAVLGVAGTLVKGERTRIMRLATIFGCFASALALLALGAAGAMPGLLPLKPLVFALGFANGLFAVSALGLMMSFAGASRTSGEGVRMGVWGAAQAGAFALGGFFGGTLLDAMRALLGNAPDAFVVIFAAEALCFVVAAVTALRIGLAADRSETPAVLPLALPQT